MQYLCKSFTHEGSGEPPQPLRRSVPSTAQRGEGYYGAYMLISQADKLIRRGCFVLGFFFSGYQKAS